MSDLLNIIERKTSKQVNDITEKLTANATSVINKVVSQRNSKASSTYIEIKTHCISSFSEAADILITENKWAIGNVLVATDEFKVSLIEHAKEQFTKIATVVKSETERAAKIANDETLIDRHFPDIRDAYESELGNVISSIEAETISRNNKRLSNIVRIAFDWLLQLLGKST